MPPPSLTQYGAQVALQRLQDGLLNLRHRFAQELLAGRAEKLVGLMMKIIHVHHLQMK